MPSSKLSKLDLINKYLYRFFIKTFMPSFLVDFSHLLEDLTENEKSFARKIDQAYQSLQDTSNLIQRLETELDWKLKQVHKLKEEHERYSSLAKVEEDKARALLKQLDISLNKGKVSERFIAFAINILAGLIMFVIGILAGPYVISFFGVT